jgi:hypothetical protein
MTVLPMCRYLGKSPTKRLKSNGKRVSALARPLRLSAELGAFVGEERMARTEVVRFVTAYVREHQLQNPDDRRQILWYPLDTIDVFIVSFWTAMMLSSKCSVSTA